MVKLGCRIHYNDVIMGKMASQISRLTIVYSTVYSSADLRKYQSSAPLAFVREIHWGPVKSPHKGQVTRKMFPFDDVIMAAIGDHRTVDNIYRWPIAGCNAVIWYEDNNQENCPSDVRQAKVPMKNELVLLYRIATTQNAVFDWSNRTWCQCYTAFWVYDSPRNNLLI